MEERVRVLVADDQDLVRSGFKLILMSYDGIDVVGEARDGHEAVELASRLHPDVVLMDIRMPRMNGIEATRAIRDDAALENVHVLILTTFDLDEYVYDALAAGASGFLLKDAEPDEIASAVRVVAQGDALIEPSITRRLIETFVAARPASLGGAAAVAAGLRPLTHRGRGNLAPAQAPRPGCAGFHEGRNRFRAVHLARHGENAPGPYHGETRCPRPRPARCPSLRRRPREARHPVAVRWQAN